MDEHRTNWFLYKDEFLGNDLSNIIETLIVHPNWISEEELNQKKFQSVFSWLFRSIICCCKNKNKNNENKNSKTLCNMCVYSNVVTIHFIHIDLLNQYLN